MKAVRVHGPNDIRIDEIERPHAGPRDVVIKIGAVGVCGTDLMYARMGGVVAPAFEPFGLGHELAGTIAEVGNEVPGIEVGQRVTVNPLGDGNAIGNGMPQGAFADYLLIPNATLGSSIIPIFDELTFERAALAEPLGVALHAVNRADPAPDAKVVVFGAGPIGLGIVIGLRERGVRDIVVFDLSDSRLDRARVLGAAAAINPSREDVRDALARLHGTGEWLGCDVVNTNIFFEASGASAVLPQIIAMAPYQAILTLVAFHKQPILTDYQPVLAKELSILASMGYSAQELAACVTLLADAKIDVEAMVSHSVPFSDFMSGFEIAASTEDSAKVIITFYD